MLNNLLKIFLTTKNMQFEGRVKAVKGIIRYTAYDTTPYNLRKNKTIKEMLRDAAKNVLLKGRV